MYPVSPAFLKAATSPDSRAVWKIDVWNQNSYLQDLPKGKDGMGGVIAWTVSSDESRQIRRTGTVELQSKGRDLDFLIPVNSGDLLSPTSGNEYIIWKGYVIDDEGNEEYAPLGIFQQTTPPKVLDVGSSISISMTLNDRSARVSAIAWDAPFPIADGMDLGAAIKSIINDRYPGLTYQFTPTNPVPGGQSLTVAAQTLGVSGGSGSNDPMADAIKLANAAGMELFFDVIGQVVLRPVPDPTTAPVVASYIYGTSTPWLSIERDPNPFGEYNGVICIGNGTGGDPVQNEAWDNDPNSKTYYLGTWGKRPYTMTLSTFPGSGQTVFNAKAQAYQAALARLQLILRFMDATTVTTVPNPALAEGDCIYEQNKRSGIDGNFVISTLSLSSDVSVSEPLGTRPQRSAVVP